VGVLSGEIHDPWNWDGCGISAGWGKIKVIDKRKRVDDEGGGTTPRGAAVLVWDAYHLLRSALTIKRFVDFGVF
jgi:hypothetical protein